MKKKKGGKDRKKTVEKGNSKKKKRKEKDCMSSYDGTKWKRKRNKCLELAT